ncbi:unnamed protein product [Didymodactylos carnosus]|uniref:Uncharacterized protein n=1 Tax=Didymodactylos carnosus TaxID=1234261 RepID=A0A8S2MP16_9BILA|nr:unnamed protein product [Didymodactylos carnosus]CAF3953856.1 unnamed protein product [Didymodactylos carnosus]
MSVFDSGNTNNWLTWKQFLIDYTVCNQAPVFSESKCERIDIFVPALIASGNTHFDSALPLLQDLLEKRNLRHLCLGSSSLLETNFQHGQVLENHPGGPEIETLDEDTSLKTYVNSYFKIVSSANEEEDSPFEDGQQLSVPMEIPHILTTAVGLTHASLLFKYSETLVPKDSPPNSSGPPHANRLKLIRDMIPLWKKAKSEFEETLNILGAPNRTEYTTIERIQSPKTHFLATPIQSQHHSSVSFPKINFPVKKLEKEKMPLISSRCDGANLNVVDVMVVNGNLDF